MRQNVAVQRIRDFFNLLPSNVPLQMESSNAAHVNDPAHDPAHVNDPLDRELFR